MKKFGPISLLYCSFKIFSEVLTNRLSAVLQHLIAPNQFAFVKGRFILESVITSHESFHFVRSSHDKDLVLKLDYEKSFGKVNPNFLAEFS
jgi:hypothetical protein